MKKYLMEIFKVFTAGMAVLFLMEIFWPGMARAYINLNLILILWILNSIMILKDFKNSD